MPKYRVLLIDERDGQLCGSKELHGHSPAVRRAVNDSQCGFIAVVATDHQIRSLYVNGFQITVDEILDYEEEREVSRG